jgi:hypothetical protein
VRPRSNARSGKREGPAPAGRRESDLGLDVRRYEEAFSRTHRPGSLENLGRGRLKALLDFAAARGVTTVQAVSRAFCRDHLESLVGALSPDRIKTERGFPSPVFSRAVEGGLTPSNPWKGSKIPGEFADHAPRATFGAAMTLRVGSRPRLE